MKEYTLGFIFTPSLDKVLLIHKLNPERQRGKLNGVGGKLEEGEDILTCMVREVQEETGLITKTDKWISLGLMESADWKVHVFTLVYEGNPNDAKSADKEKVEWIYVKALPTNMMSNLTWLLPLAIDKIQHQEFHSFSVQYNEMKNLKLTP